jgi:ketosteroid isomerase-like protein
MMQGPDGPIGPEVRKGAQWRSVADWIDAWGREVAGVELSTARRRFAADVVAFGTYADVVVGLDALHDEQWSPVWPAIRDFRFRTEDLVVQASSDGLQAVAIVPWDSTGVAADGSEFPRPGRATVVMRRDSLDSPWLGTHTHFSLARGVPSTSHGSRR